MLGVALLGLVGWITASPARGASISFSREIRPILSEHCFACHGPDEKTRKAGLRLDQEDAAKAALKSGHRAIVAGQPDSSALMARVLESDPDEIMPPPEMKKPLNAAKIQALRQWLEQGAKFEGHWAYIPPKRPELPEVKKKDWPVNEIDHFVLARLEKEGLEPNPPASKEKILRRASLDLTGLPPTVEELDAFLADDSPKAYEKVVDRLLASPHYGERMAQTWLDLARFGETQGYHHDRHRDLWHWRDWVIRAFNTNLPYDRFTTEQLAGDLLPSPTREQRIATGFHRNEMTTSEGGALPEEYSVKYVVGRVDTTARVWLGTSMACAECHDHKYDPITQRDFYRLFAFFNQVPENGLDAEELNPVPNITLESDADRAKWAKLDGEAKALEAAAKLTLEAPQADWDSAQDAWDRGHRERNVKGWTVPALGSSGVQSAPRLAQGTDGAITLQPAGTGRRYDLEYAWPEGSLTGIRLDVFASSGKAGGPVPTNTVPAFQMGGIDLVARATNPDLVIAKAGVPRLGHWHVAGPFRAGSAREAHDKVFGPESATDTRGRFQDGKVGWEERVDVPDGEPVALKGQNVAYFWSRTVRVETAQVRWVYLGSADGLQVWVNGRRVFSRSGARELAIDQDKIRIALQSGENRLLIKASHGTASGGFAFRLGTEPLTEWPFEWASAVATEAAPGNPASNLVDADPKSAWGTVLGRDATVWIRTAEPFGFPGGTRLLLGIHSGLADGPGLPERFRLAFTGSGDLQAFLDLPEPVRIALIADPATRSEAQRMELRRFYRSKFVPEVQEAERLAAARRKERDDFRRSWPSTMVMKDAEKPKDTFLLVRGQYNNRGEQVTAGVPERIHRWNEAYPKNRLGLAQWLLDADHPLTSRVAVNQFWQKYFGAGIVKTAEEFGSQGEWPSHPDLLDWLAREFVDSAWNIKALQRRIVLSATYRQDASVSRQALEKDPENRLFSRGPRFRVDAEGIRDIAMAVSGLLDARIGGPSVFPYQPPGLWGQVSFEGTRDYMQSEGADNYRRGLYTYWRRSIPYASFTLFDAPTRETCTVRRPRTNTPLQALNLLNDPVYLEAARALGQRILAKGGETTGSRVFYAFRVCLGRSPTEAERAVLESAVRREFQRFAKDREAANRLIHIGLSRPPVEVDIAELAAWTVVGSTLLNLDETITKG